jgi:hypothetical protein
MFTQAGEPRSDSESRFRRQENMKTARGRHRDGDGERTEKNFESRLGRWALEGQQQPQLQMPIEQSRDGEHADKDKEDGQEKDPRRNRPRAYQCRAEKRIMSWSCRIHKSLGQIHPCPALPMSLPENTAGGPAGGCGTSFHSAPRPAMSAQPQATSLAAVRRASGSYTKWWLTNIISAISNLHGCKPSILTSLKHRPGFR